MLNEWQTLPYFNVCREFAKKAQNRRYAQKWRHYAPKTRHYAPKTRHYAQKNRHYALSEPALREIFEKNINDRGPQKLN